MSDQNQPTGEMNDAIEWMRPEDALRLIWQPGQMLSHQDRARIIRWGKDGRVRAKTKTLITRSIVKDQAPQTQVRQGNFVMTGQPMAPWDWPIERITEHDVIIDGDDWELPGFSDPHAQWWDTGELELNATDGSRAGLNFYGIELAKDDIMELVDPRANVSAAPALPADRRQAEPAELTTKKGRPRKGEGTWETQLFGELLGLATGGDWHPGGALGFDRGGQADIERKIADWLSEHNHDVPADSTIADIANKLLTMIRAIRKAGG